MKFPEGSALLKISTAAHRLDCSTDTIKRRARDGAFKLWQDRSTGYLYVETAEFQEYVAKSYQPWNGDEPADSPIANKMYNGPAAVSSAAQPSLLVAYLNHSDPRMRMMAERALQD